MRLACVTVPNFRIALERARAPELAGRPVAIGEGKFIAWIAATVSAYGEVAVVPAGCEQQFLAPLSTSFLPVSYEVQRKLALYNLRTIGEIAVMPIGALQAQFGREGKRLWQLARG